MQDKPLLVEETREGSVGISGLLTCGHYAGPFHEASGVWDGPDEAYACPNGCGERQFDLRLQLHLMAMRTSRTAPYDWAADDEQGNGC
jgi:hypothetical protein